MIKTAIIADWLTTYAGAERVIEQILHCFPEADVFSLVDFLSAKERGFLQGKPVKTTFIQKLPFAKKHFRKYLSLMPLAIESLDLRGYDLIISSSHAVAKGVIVGPDQVHVSYVHSPMRYAWDLQAQYLQQTGLDKCIKGWLTRKMLHKLRIWDVVSSNRVDYFISNSDYIGRRIQKVYRRDFTTIYPPVAVEKLNCVSEKQDFYVTASRMVPYKRVDLIVSAFARMPDKKLIVLGDGPEFFKVQQLAKRFSNIELKGYLPSSEMFSYIQKAKAFVFAAEEDFGILPVEAQACGTPVIAFGRGGASETVIDFIQAPSLATGVLFTEQTELALRQAVQKFEGVQDGFDFRRCRAQAEKFATPVFHDKIQCFIAKILRENSK